MRRILSVLLLCNMAILFTAGCIPAPQPIPTVANLQSMQTAQVLTLNAPPTGFETSVSFPHVDDNLTNLSGWHYKFSLSFDGVYSGTQDKVQGLISAEIYSNEVGSARRVLLKATGAAFGPQDRNVEGVRISNDYYLVDQNQQCNKVTGPADQKVADLTAGSLIGGVKRAVPTAQRKTVNNVNLWEYTFTPNDVNPPSVQLGTGGKITIAAGDLWVAPAKNAVYEYTLTLNVENAVLQGDRQLTGQVRATYNLIETDVAYNISIPNGC